MNDVQIGKDIYDFKLKLDKMIFSTVYVKSHIMRKMTSPIFENIQLPS